MYTECLYYVFGWLKGSLEFPKLPYSGIYFNCCFCRQSKHMHNYLSRLEQKVMTMNGRDFWNFCSFSGFYYCALWCMISVSGFFIAIQYGLVMFCFNQSFGVERTLVSVYWCFLVFIMEHFEHLSKSFEHFVFSL